MAKLIKRFSFEAAHYLPKHKGLCKNTHGHHWVLDVCIKGEIDKESGMVVDYQTIKEVVQNMIISKFDHSFLNDWFEDPTSENIAKYIYDTLSPIFLPRSTLEYVDLWETEKSHCIYP